MYLELLKNSAEDGGGFLIHMCVYNEDNKGRRIIGCPVTSPEELRCKTNMIIVEVNEILKQGLAHFERTK